MLQRCGARWLLYPVSPVTNFLRLSALTQARRDRPSPFKAPWDAADAHGLIAAAHTTRLVELRPRMCDTSIRRPNGLAFNAHVFLIQAYEGKRSVRTAYRKDDYYLDLHLPPNDTVPDVFAERFLQALLWLERHHTRMNITVVVIGVLTANVFLLPPRRDTALATVVARLQRSGVIILANGGNCRQWHRNCTGQTWPSIVDGITPVGATTTKPRLGVFRSTALEPASCDAPEQLPLVCGARYSSSALPYLAAGMQLLGEAFRQRRLNGYQNLQRTHETLQDAMLRLIHSTGTTVLPNRKANACSNRRCANFSRALEEALYA